MWIQNSNRLRNIDSVFGKSFQADSIKRKRWSHLWLRTHRGSHVAVPRFRRILRSCLLGSFCMISGSILDSLEAADSQPATPVASTKSPEVCFVKLQTAGVYCGPAKNFYLTEELTRGDSVDVYYRTKDGWCAIRPPKGSHNWLAAEQAYLLPGGKKAEVVGKKTPAWIGSDRLGDKDRLRWQIELQPSQQVEVIGETKQAIDSDKARLWYRILPPPGDFRWMRAESLANQPPTLRLNKADTEELASIDPPSMIQKAVAHQINSDSGSASSSVAPIPIPDANSSLSGEPIIVGQPESGPRVGEYIEGEGTVISSSPAPWTNENVHPLNQGHHGEIVMDGQIVMEGDDAYDQPWNEGESGPCPHCNQTGCTTCDASHQTDSIDYWANQSDETLPPVRFRPLARILGLIGLSVVEGESVVDPVCRGQAGCQCAKCLQHPGDLHPRSSGRFGHLPRPTRSNSRPVPGEWLGEAESNIGNRSLLESNRSRSLLADDYRSSAKTRPFESKLDRRSSPSDWQGLASSKYTTEDSDLLDRDYSNSDRENWSSLERPHSGIRSASADSELLKFSTPEIQAAMNELTRRVAEPLVSWELRTLASEAQRWIDQAADPIARGEARLLMERIEQFEILRRRSQGQPENAIAMAPTASPMERVSVPAQSMGFQRPADELGKAPSLSSAPVNGIDGGGAIQRNPDGTLASDASGWLVEVFSAQPGQPEFALTDDNGGLIAYVQPAPGMNLRRYVKQPVGIYGVKGYLPTLSARQIVAERIVRLR